MQPQAVTVKWMDVDETGAFQMRYGQVVVFLPSDQVNNGQPTATVIVIEPKSGKFLVKWLSDVTLYGVPNAQG